jgi:superfamily II DNA/RNA helicase
MSSSNETMKVETSAAQEFPPCKSFDEMDLPIDLLRGISSHGYEVPSVIQSVGIVPMVKGRDILGQAQSGTGKTGTFGIGLLSRIDPKLKKTQAVVISHTHELATQTYDFVKSVGKYMKTTVSLSIGGVDRHKNGVECRTGAHVVVGTPGRIWDLAKSGDLSFRDLRVFVIDEADELLRGRFADQIGEITALGIPPDCRVAFFSATMPEEVLELANSILKEPVRIVLKTDEVKLDGIKQYFMEFEKDEWKLECLCDIYESIKIGCSIIFVNTKERAERLHKALEERGFSVGVTYGELPQAIREQRMEEFRGGHTRMLIATNLIARGIDVQQLEIVFNYDIPPFEDKESFMHRIGRCGRYGRKGVAISFLNQVEKHTMDQIASHYAFHPQPLPNDLAALKIGA